MKKNINVKKIPEKANPKPNKILNHIEINSIYYILLMFIIITIIKIIMSLGMKSPFIMWDEELYSNIAQNVLSGKLYSDFYAMGGNVPPGYSLIISIAYLLSNDKNIVYHIMLAINAIITTAIIFPVYFILKKYCPAILSLSGAFLITLLPSVFLYTFILFSENLFITLFTYSVWFLLLSYETNKKVWQFLASFSVVFLYITRATGMAMMIGFIISIIYYCYLNRKDKNIILLLKEKWLLLSTFVLTLGSWLVYTQFFMPRASYSITGNSYNVESGYVSLLTSISTNLSHLVEFIQFIVVHLDYLMISTFFIAFFIIIYLVMIKYQKSEKYNSLQISFAYFLISLIGTLVVTALFMFNYYDITNTTLYGRYIDPMVPVAFLFGILGLNVLNNNEYVKIIKQNFMIITFGFVALLVFVLLTMVQSGFFFVDELPAYYLFYSHNTITFYILILLISLAAFSLIYLSLKNNINIQKLIPIIVISCTLFSIISILIAYNAVLQSSSVVLDGAISYIKDNSTPNMILLMNQTGITLDERYNWCYAEFWGKGKIILLPDLNNSSIKGVYNNSTDYIFSRQVLPYQKVSNGINDIQGSIFKLYAINSANNDSKDIPYIINFKSYDDGIVDNFDSSVYENPWTTDSSQVQIEYPSNLGDMNITISTGGFRPTDNPAHIEFFINGHKIGEGTKQDGNYDFSYIVPEGYLNEYYQVLEIRTNIWIPSDYGLRGSSSLNGGIDNRHLGITMNSITINKK